MSENNTDEIKSFWDHYERKTSTICQKIDSIIDLINNFKVDLYVDKSRLDELDKNTKKISELIDKLTTILDKVDKENNSQNFRISKLELDVNKTNIKIEEIFKYKYIIIGALIIISLFSTGSDIIAIIRMLT